MYPHRHIGQRIDDKDVSLDTFTALIQQLTLRELLDSDISDCLGSHFLKMRSPSYIQFKLEYFESLPL